MKKIIRLIKSLPRAIRTHKLRSVIIFIVLAVSGFIVFQSTRPPQYDHAAITKGTITQEVSASGKIAAHETVSLAFPAGSKVTWVGVKQGDQVKKWQAVASLDARDLQKNIKIKLLDYLTTRWDFEQTQDDYDVHGRSLNSVSLTDAEKRIIEKSQFGLDQSVLDYEIANLALEKSVLIAPIAGTVTETSQLTPGEVLMTVDAPTRVINITNLNSLYYQAEVDEVDFARIKPGMAAKISLDSFPDASISGTVAYIGQKGIKTTGGGVQVLVDIALNPPFPNLVPELTGDVTIFTQEKPNVILLNKQYLTKTNEGYTVQIFQNGRVSTKPVVVGIQNDTFAEITQGLSEGEDVVIPALKK